MDQKLLQTLRAKLATFDSEMPVQPFSFELELPTKFLLPNPAA